MVTIPGKIINHLRALSTGDVEPIDREEGVCTELKRLFKLDPWPDGLDLSAWPRWSGFRGHPVPAPESGYLRARHVRYYHMTPAKWAADEYGDNRREFCAFLADQFELLNAEASQEAVK